MSGLFSFCRQETEGEEEIEKKVEKDEVNKEVNKEGEKMLRSEKRVLATNLTDTTESEWGSCRSEAWQCFSSNMEVCSPNLPPLQ